MSAEYSDISGPTQVSILKSRNRLAGLFFILAILSSAVPLHPEMDVHIPVRNSGRDDTVSLHDLVTTLNLNLSLEPASGRIRLYYKEHFAIFATGYSHMILDGRLYKADIPVARENGDVMLPQLFAQAIAKRITGKEIIREGDFLVAGHEESLPEKMVPSEKEPAQVIAPERDRIGFIIIDAGHGGKDPGAIGKGGLREKDMTLAISRELAAYLKKKLPGVKVCLSRNRDIFLELGERTDMANRKLVRGVNGLFISVHVNASLVPRISGFETYFLSQNASNEDARSTAALENGVIILEEKSNQGKRYGDVDYIEAMMLTTQIQKESSLLAESIQRGLSREISEFKSHGVKKADFFVLRGSLMPAALVEVGYITNSREAGFLKTKSYQNRLARGIGDGILGFMKQYQRMI